jgi:hypothetical protein
MMPIPHPLRLLLALVLALAAFAYAGTASADCHGKTLSAAHTHHAMPIPGTTVAALPDCKDCGRPIDRGCCPAGSFTCCTASLAVATIPVLQFLSEDAAPTVAEDQNASGMAPAPLPKPPRYVAD